MSFRTAVYRLELLAIRALLGCVALPKSVAPSYEFAHRASQPHSAVYGAGTRVLSSETGDWSWTMEVAQSDNPEPLER